MNVKKMTDSMSGRIPKNTVGSAGSNKANKDKNKKERAENPNRRRSLYLGNIIFLSALTIASLLFALIVFFRVRGQGTDGFRQFYSDKQIDNIRETAAEKERNALRLKIQSSLESGRSTTQMLRDLFDDCIVVMSGGRYYFYPTMDEVEKNPLTPGMLNRVEETVKYSASDLSVAISPGILLRDANGKIDWKRLAGSQIAETVVMVGKATENGFTEDQQCERNCRHAVESEMRITLCVEMDEAASEEAMEEAGDMIDAIIAQYGRRAEQVDSSAGAVDPVVLVRLSPVQEPADEEDEKKALTEAVLFFCKDLEERDITPVLGGSLFTFAARIDLSRLTDYDRWLIDHEESAGFPYSFSFWEYTAEGHAEGVPGGAVLYARVRVEDQLEIGEGQ